MPRDPLPGLYREAPGPGWVFCVCDIWALLPQEGLLAKGPKTHTTLGVTQGHF